VVAINVKDEFSRLRVVIAHDALNAIDISMAGHRRLIEPELLQEHPETGPVFRHRVIEQQAQFLDFLNRNGVEVLSPNPQATAFCQVFTRDPCFAVRDTLFLGSLRDPYRHSEVTGLVDIGRASSAVAALWGNGAMIEGGDVFVIDDGKMVLVGMHRHTNQAGFDLLARRLRESGVEEVVAVPHKALHLDCCFAPLPNGEALIAGDRLTDEGRQLLERRFHLIELDSAEASLHLAANLLWLDARRVLSGTLARRTNELLRSRGYEAHELDLSQMVCMWGSFRCVACPLVRG
jgi:N-dimethylarginine dimethylaminohydrolase